MEIPLYKKRKSLGQNQAIEVTLHKRDDVVAILPIPFKEIPEDQKQLFLSIMKTITSQNPIIEEVSLCLLYTSPSPRDAHESRMPSSA